MKIDIAESPMPEKVSLPVRERAIALGKWLDENKARNLTVLDVSGRSSCMDMLLVATASSARHARALADGILEQSKVTGCEYLRMEGYQAGLWILLDLNDIVVHIFQAETRDLYHIESLWQNANVLDMHTSTDTSVADC